MYGWGGSDRTRDDRSLSHGHPLSSALSNPTALGSNGPSSRAPPPPPPKRHAHGPHQNPANSRLHLKNAAWHSIGGKGFNGPPGPHDKRAVPLAERERPNLSGFSPLEMSPDRPSSFSDKRVEFMLKCAALKDNEFKPGGAGPASSSPSPDPLDLIQRTNNGDMAQAHGPGPHGPSQRARPSHRGQAYDRPSLRAAQQSGPTNQRFTPSATRCLIKHNELEAQLYEQGSGKAYPFRSPLDWSEHTARGHHGRKMSQKRPHGMQGGPPLSGSIYLGGGFAPQRGRTTH